MRSCVHEVLIGSLKSESEREKTTTSKLEANMQQASCRLSQINRMARFGSSGRQVRRRAARMITLQVTLTRRYHKAEGRLGPEQALQPGAYQCDTLIQ